MHGFSHVALTCGGFMQQQGLVAVVLVVEGVLRTHG